MLNGNGTTFDPPRQGNADMAGLQWRTPGGRSARMIVSMGEFTPVPGMPQKGDARLYISGVETYRAEWGDCVSKWAEYKEIKK